MLFEVLDCPFKEVDALPRVADHGVASVAEQVAYRASGMVVIYGKAPSCAVLVPDGFWLFADSTDTALIGQTHFVLIQRYAVFGLYPARVPTADVLLVPLGDAFANLVSIAPVVIVLPFLPTVRASVLAEQFLFVRDRALAASLVTAKLKGLYLR